MSAALRINLLGSFGTFCGDVFVTAFNILCLQSLTAYLILHWNTPQSRRHLAFLLWSDSTEAQARMSFCDLLHIAMSNSAMGS